jgi:REP element-mobilizing transposase RayT
MLWASSSVVLDAVHLPTRPSGAKEGVLVAWGYDETGQRVLLDVGLGQRERFEGLEMGRGLVRRGLGAVCSRVAGDLGETLLALHGEPDHVHLLVRHPPTLAVATLVNRLKGASSRALRNAGDCVDTSTTCDCPRTLPPHAVARSLRSSRAMSNNRARLSGPQGPGSRSPFRSCSLPPDNHPHHA